MTETLFEVPAAESSDPAPKLSAGRRLTLRQKQQIKDGIHPLGGELHEAADRTRTSTSGRNDPFTCGSCRYREVIPYHNRSYAKCGRDGAPVTHGPATDVRAWWPACQHYEPLETQ